MTEVGTKNNQRRWENEQKLLCKNNVKGGKPLLFWAVEWFKNSNDNFFYKYGFNFNPHDYPNLYLIARNEVYGSR